MIKILKNLNSKEIVFIFLAMFFIGIQVYLDLKIPDYMSKITEVLQNTDGQMKDIFINGGYMLLCALISLSLAFIVGYLSAYVGVSFEKNLRKKIYNKVQSFNMEEINKFSTGSLITRATNDITQIKTFVIIGIQMLVRAVIMVIIAILKIKDKEWEFSIVTVIGVCVILTLSLTLIFVAIPRFKKIQKLTDNLNKLSLENLKGLRVIRAYNGEDYQINKFKNANNELTNVNIFTGKVLAIISPTMSTVMSGLSLFIYLVGAYMINDAKGVDKIGIFSDMVVFSSYSMQIIMAFMMLTILFIIYPRAIVSINRVNEVIDTNSKIVYGNVDSNESNEKGVVEYKNVYFKYPDGQDYVLKDISFKANKGETVAIIGSTGCGKSSLINLMPRFFDVTSGEILIDGINIKDMKEEYLYDKFGYVSQRAVLFKGSIKDNVSFGKINGGKVDIKEIEKSLDISKASEFVSELENNINYEVSQGGTNLSGGQKQRLSIARAISRNPEIYIFDDTFSALDYKTDYNLRKELKENTSNKTKFIVGQRIGTIKDADKIIVLKDGEIVGIGKHKELLQTCEVYLEIAKSQLSKEEIENAWS